MADGTRIGCTMAGEGPPLILVEPAGHFREYSACAGLVPLLSAEYTVITYDRRGRGTSTDTPPCAPDREVEDLAALITDAGGSAYVSATRLTRCSRCGRPPPVSPSPGWPSSNHRFKTTASLVDPLTGELRALVEAGRRGDAVAHFHRSIGVPDDYVAAMRASPEGARRESVAHTLAYDGEISESTTPALLGSVTVPSLVIDSEGSSGDLTGWAARVARWLPHASHQSLPGGWHRVRDETLAPILMAFFRA